MLLFNLRNDMVPAYENDPDSEQVPRAVIKPDMETIYSVPWCGGDKCRVAEVICESYWLRDQTPQLACPRFVARQQLQRLADHDFKLLSGFEVEFMFVNNEGFSSERNYMSQRELSKRSDFHFEAEQCMCKGGVDIESFHCEYAAGCFETILTPLMGIAAADAAFKFKNNIHEIAYKHNLDISFKTKQGKADIGMHFNHSLWSHSDNINVFSTKEGLSEIGKHWLAGLMKHSKALTALLNPTTNCFDRLHRPHKPGAIFWGHNERSACVKVQLIDAKKGIYLENRMPSAMSNPYIVLAATAAAGLDGVVKKLECPPAGNVAVDRLPKSLSDAVLDLLNDTDMVDSLGKEFVDWFVRIMRSDIKS